MATTPMDETFKSLTNSSNTIINNYRKFYPSPWSITPHTPETCTPIRRSARQVSRRIDLGNYSIDSPWIELDEDIDLIQRRKSVPRKRTADDFEREEITKKKKRKISEEKEISKSLITRVYYSKVVMNGVEFEIGDDVYVNKGEEDSVVYDCKICFESDSNILLECDDCLGGFHLKCLTPPLKEVPEGNWICQFCENQAILVPKPPERKNPARTAREKLLSSDLMAARIENLWKEVDGEYWIRAHWYTIPQETDSGNQPLDLKRELYLTNEFTDIEMKWILRHCFVKSPKDFSKMNNSGDDVFLCEYEYDVHRNSFKRLDELDNGDSERDKELNPREEEQKEEKCIDNGEDSKSKKALTTATPANPVKESFFSLDKVGTNLVPEMRSHKQTELEKAKSVLLLATHPKSLPCRDKEMEEITAFIKGSILDDQCLGRCMYIHGVPGTGKTISVLSVIKNLKAEVEAGSVSQFNFVGINGLKLASPENIYSVIYEALSGHRVDWKKALQSLNKRFAEGKKIEKEDDKACILLIDELDLLVNRNQGVLYNVLDWPTKPNSKLVVLCISNTMDLPEKLLPRISSRMGIQRLCFSPYNHTQLQEIISTRLKGINAFEKQAIEFASRKVAAISGDARRVLEICRRAAEVADYRVKNNKPEETDQLVIMADVEVAIQEMFQAPHIQVMKSVCKLSKIFLTAMVQELYKTGMAETTFERVATTVSFLCLNNREAFPGWDMLLKICCDLGECRIILCESGQRHRLQQLQLNFPSDDVAFALKDNKDIPWLATYL